MSDLQEVFEKIINKLEEQKEYYKDIRKNTYCRVTETDNCDSCRADHYLDARLETINSAIEIVKQAAEKYDNGWIPCSERLPEDMQTCLVTARIYFTPDHVDEIDNYIGVGIDTYSKQFGWLGTEPIAWQPLPDPYQPKGEIDG